MIKLVLAFLICALFSWPAIVSSEAATEETRQTMQRIFEALRVVFPLSADDPLFEDSKGEASIRESLRVLSEQTTALSDHVNSSDVGFEYLGASLGHSSADAYLHYNAQRFATSQALIQHMTNYCVACHSKLPSPGDSPLAQSFVSQTDITKLPLEQRAELQVATRQFDTALRTYEELIANPLVHPADIIDGPLTDYLILCIRVKDDLSRPVSIPKEFARRPNLWRAMREDLAYWVNTLERLHDERNSASTLERGRKLIEVALTPETYPMDRRPLVQYIVASSVLNRFIKSRDPKSSPSPKLAEAYYLLGLTEYRIGRDFWISQAEHYLEAAIRLAPREPFAKRAYALLEEETILGYSGSGGTRIPDDVAEHLKELSRLVDGKTGSNI